ncbi:hypothetical protein D6D08_10738 [Aureobasidium pullulans]|nr:hypothetical protein D6D08_10738 [Aureobasidium pullulans]
MGEGMNKLSPRYRFKINDGHNIDSLKVLIKRYYALDAGFVRTDSYPKTNNPRRLENTLTIGSSSSSSGNRGRSSGNPPKPYTNDNRPNLALPTARSSVIRDNISNVIVPNIRLPITLSAKIRLRTSPLLSFPPRPLPALLPTRKTSTLYNYGVDAYFVN